jgi:hypothetical protein
MGKAHTLHPIRSFLISLTPKVVSLIANDIAKANRKRFPKHYQTLLGKRETPALLEKLKRFSALLSTAMGPPHTRGLMCLYHELASISQAFSEDTKVAHRVQPLCPCEIRICLMMTAHLNHMRYAMSVIK